MGPGCAVHGSEEGSQSAAVSPWYSGWTQLCPLSKEKYAPESPTPRLKVPSGYEQAPAVVEACFEHGCMSTRSFDPAARTLGLVGSTASEGSFWAFCMCWSTGLATVTNASVACFWETTADADPGPPTKAVTRPTIDPMLISSFLIAPSPRSGLPARAVEAATRQLSCQTPGLCPNPDRPGSPRNGRSSRPSGHSV